MVAMLVPQWDHRYPGRFSYELARLQEAGATYEIDQGQLEKGRLTLTVSWPRGTKGRLGLIVNFPDSYPQLRPAVRVQSKENYPPRHCSPIDGTLCLLGRDSAQWKPSMTLAGLLHARLDEALLGIGDEDPQGEPDEYWWKQRCHPESYILVDSDSIPEAGTEGSIKIRYVAKKGSDDSDPVIRGLVEKLEIFGANIKDVSPKFAPSEILESRQTIEVPFISTADRMVPTGDHSPDFIVDVIKKYGLWNKSPIFKLTMTQRAKIFAISYGSELQFQEFGRAWLFVLLWGSKAALGAKGGQIKLRPIAALRAGPTDVGIRVPIYGLLADKKVALFGAGALGAPLSLELARNGLAELTLLDHDAVEPGNSIRWPLGASSWNEQKVRILRRFIQQEYPTCKVTSVEHAIGAFSGEDGSVGDFTVIDSMLDGSDLAIDATASFGPMLAIAEESRKREIPFVTLYATPGLLGGAVALFMPSRACPMCLEHQYAEGNLIRPLSDEDDLIQPVGCSERTFTGSSFDLAEVSEQAMRFASAILDGSVVESVVSTMDFVNQHGIKVPMWRTDIIEIHPACPSHGA